jgi:hypothetical protein
VAGHGHRYRLVHAAADKAADGHSPKIAGTARPEFFHSFENSPDSTDDVRDVSPRRAYRELPRPLPAGNSAIRDQAACAPTFGVSRGIEEHRDGRRRNTGSGFGVSDLSTTRRCRHDSRGST